MTQIRVDPKSVATYGETAEGLFKSISNELTMLVDNALGLHYEGRHGAEFKSAVGTLAIDFATHTHQNMLAIARMVHSATQAIASSLGGNVLSIPITAPDLAPPKTSFDQVVDVETTILKGFTETVTSHFTNVSARFGDHLSALIATDWHGDAKISVSKSVSTATEASQTSCTTALEKVNARVLEQLTLVETADKGAY